MNRLVVVLLVAVAALGAWSVSERGRLLEDEHLAEMLANAQQLAQTRLNTAYVEYRRTHLRLPGGNADVGLPPPEAWHEFGYDRVQLYPNGDVRFEFHRQGEVHAYVWRSPALMAPGAVSCAVRGIPVRVLQHVRMSCNVEISTADASLATDALPPIPRAPPLPADLVMEAVSRDDAAALIQLRQNGGLCQPDSMGRTALAEAARGSQAKAMQQLLVSDCPIDAIEPATGRTALMVACATHQLLMAELLLNNGANPVLVNSAGESAWFLLGTSGYAVPGSDQQLRTLMLEKGARVDQTDAQGQTLLMVAAANGSSDLVQWLLAHGAALDLQDGEGRSALMHAVTASRGERALPVLLERGSSLKLTDRSGQNALALARQVPDPARRQRVLSALSDR